MPEPRWSTTSGHSCRSRVDADAGRDRAPSAHGPAAANAAKHTAIDGVRVNASATTSTSSATTRARRDEPARRRAA